MISNKPANDYAGQEFIIIREFAAPERLVFTTGALDEKGSLIFELLHTATFEEREGKTAFKLHSRVIKTSADAGKYLGGFEAGMTQSLEKLAEHLTAKSGPLVVERTYDAPAALVWKALTTAEDIRKWSFDVTAFEPRVGFEFQFYGGKGDDRYLHHSRVTEVIPGKKLAYTWRYEGYEGDSLVTFELFEEGRQTRVRLTHEGLDTFPKTEVFARSNFTMGWTHIVGSSLKELVETQAA